MTAHILEAESPPLFVATLSEEIMLVLYGMFLLYIAVIQQGKARVTV